MGMLGQRENAFLADRIFDVFDADCDGTLNFDEFVSNELGQFEG